MRARFATPLLLTLAAACDGTAPAPHIDKDAEAVRAQPSATQPGGSATARSSRYTSIAAEDCEVVARDRETGGSRARCAGVGGFRVEVVEGDARSSLDVLPPRGGRAPLRLSTMAGGAFSRLGPRVEWRADGAHAPDALIVRYEAFEFPEQPGRTRSYLVVAKLSPTGACVVATIAPAPTQNASARQAADRAQTLPCVEPGAPAGQSRTVSP